MTNKELLKYIQLYTGCHDFALKRIESLLDKERKEIKVLEKVVLVDRFIRNKYKPCKTIQQWSHDYFKENNTTYEFVNKKCRKVEVCRIRNTYCKAAYTEGFTFSEIGRYLNRNHTTIMHNVHNIKTT